MSGQQHAPAALYPWKDPVPLVQEAGWVTGPVWTGGKSRRHRDSIPGRPARSQSLYRLSYRAHRKEGRKVNKGANERNEWNEVRKNDFQAAFPSSLHSEEAGGV